ncbi:uncharacterized protein LOC120139152 [Hibiscus syriacus]|uniref:uncharacterized protein LOC120139152 n=1 Tax=Hibiscus syriacus TaxID=106335 RepID=UPI001922D925|nr:uncharacterized protein LOC120139152 [Hibiscus syriacus]
MDNTLLAQELVKGNGRKNISPKAAIKIDLLKAFDSLNWDFISSTLFAIGHRGIRQGDPLSPILFMMAMNILSKILNLAAARGNLESIVGVTTVLNHFYTLSGLNLNINKTEFYATGIFVGTLDSIKSATGFKQGFLPVRYLGVHLFLIPQKVINRLEQLCARFLWKGSDKAAKGTRISWNKLCCPKSEGGLGLKDLSSWNKACMVQLIRKILTSNGSLWVAWIHCYVIKNSGLSDINGSSSLRWSFRRLLKLRTEALPIIYDGITKTSAIWDELREHRDKVPWQKMLWFPLHIPKQSIISWMIILDRLPTRDRLFRMGITTDQICILCNVEPESRNHLFF